MTKATVHHRKGKTKAKSEWRKQECMEAKKLGCSLGRSGGGSLMTNDHDQVNSWSFPASVNSPHERCCNTTRRTTSTPNSRTTPRVFVSPLVCHPVGDLPDDEIDSDDESYDSCCTVASDESTDSEDINNDDLLNPEEDEGL